jgi:hypothetical protein
MHVKHFVFQQVAVILDTTYIKRKSQHGTVAIQNE